MSESDWIDMFLLISAYMARGDHPGRWKLNAEQLRDLARLVRGFARFVNNVDRPSLAVEFEYFADRIEHEAKAKEGGAL